MDVMEFILSSVWRFLGSLAFTALILQFILHVLSRTYRMIMVSLRGWPPTHLDADGDQVENESDT